MKIKWYKLSFLFTTLISIFTIIYGIVYLPLFNGEAVYMLAALMVFVIIFNTFNFYWNRYRGNWKYFVIAILFMLGGVSIFMTVRYPDFNKLLISLFLFFYAMAMFVGSSLMFEVRKNPPPINFFKLYSNR